MGGMYRSSPHLSSGGYVDDSYECHYGGRDGEKNGYGRDYGDDEKYGRYGDSYSRDGDRYPRDFEGDYGRDENSRGRHRSFDGLQSGSRSRSSKRYGDSGYDDDDQRFSRASFRGEDHYQDGRSLQRKFSEQNLSAPPSYEEAVADLRSPSHSERDGETPTASAPQSSSPTGNATPESLPHTNPNKATAEHPVLSHPNEKTDAYDGFDPCGVVSAASSTSNNGEVDLIGSLSQVLLPGPMVVMPASPGTANMEADTANAAPVPTFSAATSENNVLNQSFEDPFGDTPFKAITSDEHPAQSQNFASVTSFQPAENTLEHMIPAAQKAETVNPDFADAFTSFTADAKTVPHAQTMLNPQFSSMEPQSPPDNDILAGILPLSTASQAALQTPFAASTGVPELGSQSSYPASPSPRPAIPGFAPQSGSMVTPFMRTATQNLAVPTSQHSNRQSFPYSAPSAVAYHGVGFHAQAGTVGLQQNNFLADIFPQAGQTNRPSSQATPSSSADSLALVPQQPVKQKFEPKSAVWADTLSRGLVNLDISGPNTNPMADIGIDFDSLNRKEKRMEKPNTTPSTSNVNMGKAMGSGSGFGRAGTGTGALRPAANPMMGMGMGGRPGIGIGMGGYGSMGQQPMGMGGMNMGMGMGMGMGGMNISMGQGTPIQPSNGLAPGSNMNHYNPMTGRGGYPQPPYGGGY